MRLTVIICTHNPRSESFRRTLCSLSTQTLPKEDWELLVVDNASRSSIADVWDLSWHPHARHVFEGQLGLSKARECGIREALAELLVLWTTTTC